MVLVQGEPGVVKELGKARLAQEPEVWVLRPALPLHGGKLILFLFASFGLLLCKMRSLGKFRFVVRQCSNEVMEKFRSSLLKQIASGREWLGHSKDSSRESVFESGLFLGCVTWGSPVLLRT